MYEKLFEPINVGGVTIKNRIVRSPHGTGLFGDDFIAYHVARAKGGVGMSTVSATSVHPNAPGAIALWDDSCKPYLSKLANAVHEHGMKMFHQIYHPGASQGEMVGGAEAWSASEIPNFLGGAVVPLAISRGQIDDLVEHYANAARRIYESGLDGVDIHASSGYLVHEFLSPALNQRDDEYGGSPENRMRLLLEIIDAIRGEVGEGDFAVGVRLPNEDYVPGGLTADLNRQIAETVDPLVDYVSLHMGSYWRFHKLIAPTDDPLGVEMSPNATIRPVITKPSIVVGRILTMDHAHALVDSGQADMVSMVRALIADPELVNKAHRGDEDLIRPCIGTNIGCVGRLMSGQGLSCVVNVAAGQEATVTQEPEIPAEESKRVLVVGGGPAGMEFARTAAIRGHHVQLHEATQKLGGQVNIAASAPRRGDVGAITHWLGEELKRLQVDVHLNSLVDLETVMEADADVVALATGGSPRADGFQVSTPSVPLSGHDLPHVYNAQDLMGYGDPVNIQGPAVVFDDTGSFEAISAADVLLEAGVQVTLVSRLKDLGENLPYPPVTVGAARERLMSGDFDLIGGHYLREIRPGEVDIGVLHTDRVRTLPANTVIMVTHHEPNRYLADELEAEGIEVHAIGDAQGRNSIRNAIHEGAFLGRKV